MSAELAARRTAAAAAVADFQRESQTFAYDDTLTLPTPNWGAWAHRLACEVSSLLGQLAAEAETPDAATGQLAQIRLVLAAFDWETDDWQYALEQIHTIVHGDAAPRGAVAGWQLTIRQALRDGIRYQQATAARGSRSQVGLHRATAQHLGIDIGEDL